MNMKCYRTMELAFNNKGHTYEAERHSTRVIECCGHIGITMNSVLKGFLLMNFEKLWCTLDDNLNQFSQSIITFGEHKAENVHL